MNNPLNPAPNHRSVWLPDGRTLFCRRAERLRLLAENRLSLSGYLILMADLADAQQFAFDQLPPLVEKKAAWQPEGSTHRIPLPVASWPHDPIWRTVLEQIIERLAPNVTGPVADVLNQIKTTGPERLDHWAERLLAMDSMNIDPGPAPFLAAALQVHWTAKAGALVAENFSLGQPDKHCPVCGFPPVLSVIQATTEEKGLRFLYCALCATRWRRVRILCVQCGESGRIHYDGLEGEAVAAESCGNCNRYLKILNLEKDPQAEPFADDLASLHLDILMEEAGFQRLGFNPWLIPGGE